MSLYELAIVDDQDGQAAALADLVERVTEGDEDVCFHVQSFNGAEPFRAWVRAGGQPDVVLMDIVIDGREGAGIELAGDLNRAVPSAQVVYVTGYIEYCTSVYQTDHVYFLTKPVNPGDLRRALCKAAEIVDGRRRDRIEVRFKGRRTLVEAASISYIESAGRKACIHCARGQIETYARLSDLAARLPASFVQCHKSFLVNLDHVASFEAKRFVLRTGAEVPVSKRRSKETRAAWDRHLLGML